MRRASVLLAFVALASCQMPLRSADAFRNLPCPPIEDAPCRDTRYACKDVGIVNLIRPDFHDIVLEYRSERTSEVIPKGRFRHVVRHIKGRLYYLGRQCRELRE